MFKTTRFRSSGIFYKITGTGYPVVLVHGFAEDNRIWDKQVEFLENNFRLIIPDIPGSGLSEPLRKQHDDTAEETAGKAYIPTMEDYAASIKTVLDEEGITRCIMIGHSMGGYITLAFAEKYPGMLQAFGLFHSTAYPDNEEKKTARRKSIAFIRSHGSAAFINQSTPNLFSLFSKEQYPEMVRELIEQYDNFNPLSLVSYYEAMILRPDRTFVLQTFTGPILFFIGENDQAVPLEHSLQQSHIPAISWIHILENTAHMGMLEATGEVNKKLLSFLKNVAI